MALSAAGGPELGSGGLRLRPRGQAPPLTSTGVLLNERRWLGVGRVWFFDIQGWITLILGGLLALITLFTSYSHVHLPFLGSIALNQQVGVLLLLALVPALVGLDEVFSVAEGFSKRRSCSTGDP